MDEWRLCGALVDVWRTGGLVEDCRLRGETGGAVEG